MLSLARVTSSGQDTGSNHKGDKIYDGSITNSSHARTIEISRKPKDYKKIILGTLQIQPIRCNISARDAE